MEIRFLGQSAVELTDGNTRVLVDPFINGNPKATVSADELSEAGVEKVHDPNLGGTVQFDWGWVKMVPALHSSTTPKGTVCPPAGLLIMIGDRLVYHLGDTCLFSDLKLISQRGNHVNV